MYEVKDKNKVIYFTDKADADNYNDYLKYGLKVVRTQGKIYYFNNGDRLFDVSISNKKNYILETRTGRTVTNEKLQRKYLELIQFSN